MRHRLFLWFHALIHTWRYVFTEEVLALFLVLCVFIVPVSANTRFETRGLFMQSSLPGVTTDYTISLRYMTPLPVGSVDMLFCIDPIPYMPCVTPPGLDVSGATLTNQTGETGFAISTQSTNHLILSRSPAVLPTAATESTYTLSGIKNPTDATQAFAIRLKSLNSTDGTGPQIDFGSVRGQVSNAIVIETQVPPMLVFCLAQEVEIGCTDTNETYFTDMGDLNSHSTLTARSQMAVGTNASAGFVITANGDPPTAGNNSIDGLAVPTLSQTGKNQFGINLVANNQPVVGDDPEGIWANAQPAPGYGTANLYKYQNGDVVAESPNVSLMKKFTVSYILNASPNLRAGVYTTTITFIASGRF